MKLANLNNSQTLNFQATKSKATQKSHNHVIKNTAITAAVGGTAGLGLWGGIQLALNKAQKKLPAIVEQGMNLMKDGIKEAGGLKGLLKEMPKEKVAELKKALKEMPKEARHEFFKSMKNPEISMDKLKEGFAPLKKAIGKNTLAPLVIGGAVTALLVGAIGSNVVKFGQAIVNKALGKDN